MFNSEALNIVIGLVFIYLLYSLLASIIQEIISSMRSYRAKMLEKAICRMLDDNTGKNTLVALFYNHPLMKYLGESTKHSKPAYINNSTFSKVVLDLLRSDAAKPGDDIKLLIQKTLDTKNITWDKNDTNINDDTLKFLNSIWTDSQGDVVKFKGILENWFDETMDRTTGWYKKKNQRVLFFVGLVIAIIFNVDSIKIVSKLEKDPKLTEQLVQQADNFIKSHPDLDKQIEKVKTSNSINSNKKDSLQTLDTLKARRDTLINQANRLVQADIKKVNNVLGIGWADVYNGNIKIDYQFILFSLLGWLITALALSLGAPFWFDLLNKLMKLRSSVANNNDDKQTKDAKTEKQTPKTIKG